MNFINPKMGKLSIQVRFTGWIKYSPTGYVVEGVIGELYHQSSKDKICAERNLWMCWVCSLEGSWFYYKPIYPTTPPTISLAVGLTCSRPSCYAHPTLTPIYAPLTWCLTQGTAREERFDEKREWECRLSLPQKGTSSAEFLTAHISGTFISLFPIGVNVQNPCFQFLKPLGLKGPDTSQVPLPPVTWQQISVLYSSSTSSPKCAAHSSNSNS